ncbi:MAG: ATP-binding protein [Deltaproteobacteria bacterium]|jgi:hypothetical protein|nr:ATP-binding protein [Deltaproteobacteria bacterium]
MKKLPLGVETFQEIIENNCVYADKTRFIHEIANSPGKAFFLARPRRFGKSLLLSSFEALFSGRKELFDGLWIGDNAKAQGNSNNTYNLEESFPIIHLNFAMLNSKSPQNLEGGFTHIIQSIARSHDLNISAPSISLLFYDLIRNLKRKYQKNVVLLIDEYDAPISYNIDDLELAIKNLQVLKEFYSALKPLIKDLRFVFLTGVTSYALLWHTGVLNHLIDLTMRERFSTICGFTHEEMDYCFSDYYPFALDNLNIINTNGPNDIVAETRPNILERQKILDMYDGYSWDGTTRVLNPYSLLNYFDNNNIFKTYWAEQESSSKFLTAFVLSNPFHFAKDTLSKLPSESIKITDTNSMAPATILFQTGYMTVDKIVKGEMEVPEYYLRIPNEEIRLKFKSDFTDFIFETLNIKPEDEIQIFREAILSENAETISDLITANFSKLPAQHHQPTESRYHGLLFFYFLGLPNVEVLCEPAGSQGTPDLVVKFNDGLYVIIELKYRQAEKETDSLSEDKIKDITKRLAEKGLKAIEDINYATPYIVDAKKILKMGLGIYGRGRSQALLKNGKRPANPKEAKRPRE